VEQQKRDNQSLLKWTAEMIRTRKEAPEIGWGRWKILDTGSPHVLAMQYQWREESVVVVHNFAGTATEVEFSIEGLPGQPLVDLRVESESRANRRGRHQLALDAYGYRWFRRGAAVPRATVKRRAGRGARKHR
jgi:maltose alpha-D-glucosyltransferase / alpha-amylase